ncbi:MAG: hypothetical protein WD533_00240 [Dehalococcoidia bacterium]
MQHINDWRNYPGFDKREALALELAERMTYTRRRVTDAFFKRLQRAFTGEELVELAAVIALENFRSKFNTVFAIESGGACPLPAVRDAVDKATVRLHG